MKYLNSNIYYIVYHMKYIIFHNDVLCSYNNLLHKSHFSPKQSKLPDHS